MTAPRTAELTSFEALDDKGLTVAFKQGDQAAYDIIYELHGPRVRNLCRRMLTNPHDAQEAMQETFLRVYQGLWNFNGRYQLGAWITRIATNVCVDQLRSRSRHPSDPTPIETIDLERAGDPTGQGPEDPETLFMKGVESRRVRKVLASMPPLHRAAIVLRDFEGLSYDEIAVALGITDSQVKALLHRARKSFKKSWVNGLASALLPVRLLHRLRFEVPSLEQAAHSSLNTATIVSQCSAALAQCGQALADKIAPVAVAGVLAIAGVAGIATRDRAPSVPLAPQAGGAATAATLDTTGTRSPRQVALAPKQAHKNKPQRHTAPVTAPPATDEATAPAPEPTPTPEPTDPGAGSPPSDGTQPPPGPQLLAVGLGFDYGQGVASSTARNEQATIDCAADQALTHSFEAQISNGSTSYLAAVNLQAGSSTTFDVVVYPDGLNGYNVQYDGSGSVGSRTRSGDQLHLDISGTYTNWDHDAEQAGLPSEGSFSLKVTLDCVTPSVVSESLALAGRAA